MSISWLLPMSGNRSGVRGHGLASGVGILAATERLNGVEQVRRRGAGCAVGDNRVHDRPVS